MRAIYLSTHPSQSALQPEAQHVPPPPLPPMRPPSRPPFPQLASSPLTPLFRVSPAPPPRPSLSSFPPLPFSGISSHASARYPKWTAIWRASTIQSSVLNSPTTAALFTTSAKSQTRRPSSISFRSKKYGSRMTQVAATSWAVGASEASIRRRAYMILGEHNWAGSVPSR